VLVGLVVVVPGSGFVSVVFSVSVVVSFPVAASSVVLVALASGSVVGGWLGGRSSVAVVVVVGGLSGGPKVFLSSGGILFSS
jgi:hypothetical protein